MQGCFLAHHVVVLLGVEQVVLVFVVFQVLNFPVHDESHVAVAERQVALLQNPGVAFCVESVAEIEAECLAEVRSFSLLFLFVTYLYFLV